MLKKLLDIFYKKILTNLIKFGLEIDFRVPYNMVLTEYLRKQ